MLHYPHIDPVAFSLGPVAVHWYGIMYLIGFTAAWLLGLYRARKPYAPISPAQVSDVIFYGAMGTIIGGRIGYMLFYNLSGFLAEPWIIFQVWDGGMSFHGGMLGVMIAILLFARKIRTNPWDILDFIAPMVPVGLGAGRLGNFINGELWGRVTTSPIGMVFPGAGPYPRYPSQLIEFVLEGLCLFVILWSMSCRPRQRFTMCASFLFFYGIFRFIAEFFRQPDPQLGFVLFGWVTQGQLLSAPMIIIGAWALLYNTLKTHKVYNPNAQAWLNRKEAT